MTTTDLEIAAIADVLAILDKFDPAVQRRMFIYLGSRLSANNQHIAPLTLREAEVLRELHAGATNKEIAQQLGISPATVKNHVHHVLEKLAVQRRTQASAVLRNDAGGAVTLRSLP
jgi:DNA-binding NarL/FixJ family response regulator